MYTVSDAFSAAVAGAHTVIVRADLWRAGKPIATMPDRVIGGSITTDRNAAVRGRCSVTLLDPPASLNPFGDELAIYRGVQFDDGTTEWVPCGVYGVTSIEWSHTADHAVAQCEAMDRADALAKKRWPGPWVITRGTLISDAIEAVVNDRLPGCPTRIAGTAHRTPQTVHDGANATPLDVVTELAKAAGLDVWFDRDGTFVAAPPATANDPVVATFREGPTSTVGAVTRRLQADPGANGVIVVGSSTQAEPDIWAAAWDDNPASPTYRRGPYGERPVYLGSTNVLSVEQARQVAVTELARLTASTVSLAFDTPANPALDAGDRVRVVRDASGVDDVIVVDTITLPLTLDGAMRVGAEQAIHALAARITAQASTPQVRRLGRLRSVEGDTATVEIGGQEVDAPLPAADVPPHDPILPDPDPATDPPVDPSAPPEEPYYDPYVFPTVIVPGDEISSGDDTTPGWTLDGDGNIVLDGAGSIHDAGNTWSLNGDGTTTGFGSGFDGYWSGASDLELYPDGAIKIEALDSANSGYIRTAGPLYIEGTSADVQIGITVSGNTASDALYLHTYDGGIEIIGEETAGLTATNGAVTVRSVNDAVLVYGATVTRVGATTGDLGFYGTSGTAKAAAPSTLSDVITILQNLGLCS